MNEPQQQRVPWAGFKYQPVRDLINRHVSRFLRGQRKLIRRTFREHGHIDLVRRLEDLRRDSGMGLMDKNQVFQEIMNEYIERVTPQPGAAVVGEAAPVQDSRDAGVGVPSEAPVPEGTVRRGGPRVDDGGGVPDVAGADGAGVVVEE